MEKFLPLAKARGSLFLLWVVAEFDKDAMKSKYLFQSFCVVALAVTIWVGARFALDLYDYLSLSRSTAVQVNEWRVEECKPGAFALFADYQFQVDECDYHQTFRFPKLTYNNPYMAQEHCALWSEKKWEVWYNPRNPHVASLQKLFPFKKAIHLLLCIGVVVYFVWLNGYVRRLKEEEVE